MSDVKGRPAFVFAEHGVFVALAVHPVLFTQHIVMLCLHGARSVELAAIADEKKNKGARGSVQESHPKEESVIRSMLVWGCLILTQGMAHAQEIRQIDKGDSTMKTIETERFILRAFTPEDWSDVRELSIDWSKAPGPEFDKWPTTEEGAKGLADYFAKSANNFAVCLRNAKKVVGLIALNGIDTDKQLDLGHVILSKYQDNDQDREALEAMVTYAFQNNDISSIVTRNDPHHREQIAPLQALGFRSINEKQKGELVITRNEWETLRKK